MTDTAQRLSGSLLVLAAGILLSPNAATMAKTAGQAAAKQEASKETAPSSKDRWLHVRVTSPEDKDETVKVNVPLELAEKVLPTINHDRLQNGKVKVDRLDSHGVDLRALLDAVHSSKDGEFVTVQSRDSDVRVAKQGAYMFVHVFDKKRSKNSQVEVKVPLRVVDALLSAGKDELDLVAALHALSAQSDTELVSVKDEENTVRVWLDSKNASD